MMVCILMKNGIINTLNDYHDNSGHGKNADETSHALRLVQTFPSNG